MLVEMTIRDFAIIDTLTLGFGEGFTALTGETGAGKSIIIDALGAVLGDKVGVEFVRSGRSQAHVEAMFELGPKLPSSLADLLAEQGIEPEDGLLILARDINATGRAVARINGRVVTTAVLQQVGQALVDIHGQSEHLSLLRPASHIEMLDHFAGVLQQRADVAALVDELRRLRSELTALEQDERQIAQRVDLLTYQVDEISSAALRPGEEEQLAEERIRLANAERLTLLADGAARALDAVDAVDSRRARGAIDALRDAAAQVEDLAQLDPRLTPTSEALTEMVYVLEDHARELRAYRDRIEHDPARLEEIDERLHLLRDLCRKYGATVDEVIAYGDAAQLELEQLAHRDERLAELREREQSLLRDIGERAYVLSKARRAAGERLARAVEQAIQELNMGRARFEVQVAWEPDPRGVPLPEEAGQSRPVAFDGRGIDRVEFLISPNPGEPLKPLAKIASGGETARLMLALKSILALADETPTLVFDEVDVGVGGRSGQVVGEKLWGLTRDGSHQVLCITHLPQIAAFAETHYKIAKQVIGERTTTSVTQLDAEERVDELAAMLGGVPVTPEARANAAVMLEQIGAWRAARHASPPMAARRGA